MGNIFSGDSEIHETTIKSSGGASSSSGVTTSGNSTDLTRNSRDFVTSDDGTTIDVDDDDPDTSGSGSVISSDRDNVEIVSTIGDETNKINRKDGEDKNKDKNKDNKEYNSDTMLQDFVNLLFASLWILGTIAAIRSGFKCGIGKGKFFNFIKALLFGPFYFVWLKFKCRIQVTQGV